MCRVVWERLLALSGMLYKWLSQCEVHLSSGAHHSIPKGTSFAQDSWISYWLQLVCLRTPLLPYGFQSNLVSLESYSQGKSNAANIVG